MADCGSTEEVSKSKSFRRVNFSSLFWCKRRRHTCSEIEASIEGSGVNVIKLISFVADSQTNEKVFVPEKPLHQSLKSKLIGGTLGYAEGS